MANMESSMWLKVLLGLIASIMLLGLTSGSAILDRKLDKNVFELHKERDVERFAYIKESLDRIEKRFK